MRARNFLMILSMLVACGASAKFRDASNDSSYAGLVGGRYRTLNEFLVLGVSTDRDYPPVTDLYLITEKPGFGGSEVLTKDILPAGSLLEVKSVNVCTSCLYHYLQIEVVVVGSELWAGESVFLRDMGNMTASGKDGDTTTLNPKLFAAHSD